MESTLVKIEKYIQRRLKELEEDWNSTGESSYFHRQDELEDLEMFIRRLKKESGLE